MREPAGPLAAGGTSMAASTSTGRGETPDAGRAATLSSAGGAAAAPAPAAAPATAAAAAAAARPLLRNSGEGALGGIGQLLEVGRPGDSDRGGACEAASPRRAASGPRTCGRGEPLLVPSRIVTCRTTVSNPPGRGSTSAAGTRKSRIKSAVHSDGCRVQQGSNEGFRIRGSDETGLQPLANCQNCQPRPSLLARVWVNGATRTRRFTHIEAGAAEVSRCC